MTRDREIRTPRLRLRPFSAADASGLLVLFQDEQVRRYLLDGAVVDESWVDGEIADSADRFRSGSAGLWTITAESAGILVGFAGFRPFFDPPELQLVYGLHPHHWGRGLATEAARGVIRFAFETCGFPVVRAATDTPNRDSVRVMERLGMTFVKATGEGQWGTVYYQLTKRAWEESGFPGDDDG
ncbi:MAG: GNAT family N-acetyltransferase [Gemmatimonadota bacterium]|nr:GNAT family N-acetyltransferase [Gemmatimonadota bacterium]